MRVILCLCICLFCGPAWSQDKPIANKLNLRFATQAEAASLLSAEDEFVSRLSPFDRAARLKSDEPIDKATYLKFVAEQALDWSETEKENISAAWQRVTSSLGTANIKAPAEVSFIKTTGREEGDAAYTRGAAIILPSSKAAGRGLDALVAHELFHVLSRHDADMRERLYKIIGFRKCGELQLPADMQARRLTNPDAPVNNHCIQIKHDGKPLWVVPVLTSRSAKYDARRGGEFFNYMQFDLVAIQSPDTPSDSQPMLVDGKPLLVDARKADGFMDQIGKNTGYIIHPDEILADNFSMLITKRKPVPQPELLEKIASSLGLTP